MEIENALIEPQAQEENIESILESHKDPQEALITRKSSGIATRESSEGFSDQIEYGIRQESSKLVDKDSISSFPTQRGRMLCNIYFKID